MSTEMACPCISGGVTASSRVGDQVCPKNITRSRFCSLLFGTSTSRTLWMAGECSVKNVSKLRDRRIGVDASLTLADDCVRYLEQPFTGPIQLSEPFLNKALPASLQRFKSREMSAGRYLQYLSNSVSDLWLWKRFQEGRVNDGMKRFMVSAQTILQTIPIDSNPI